METRDVLIVGGGPAGSTCARELRRAGVDVLLMDSRVFPREKPCAGWITPAVVASLALDKDDYRRSRVFQEIRGFLTGVIDGHELETRYDGVVSYGIRRWEFDHYLLERSGVPLRLGEPVTRLERKNGEWVVNGSVRTRLLVGAGGHSCPVARHLGAKNGAELIIVSQEAEFAMACEQARTCRVREDMPELFFCRDMKGYGWIFRKGDFLNVGLGRREKADFARHMSTFRAFLDRRGVAVPNSEVHWRGHAYLPYRHTGGRRKIDDGVLLIGDAAGLADPHSGEGILPAVESALMAAQTILAAKGDCRRDNLEAYAARLAARYGRKGSEIPFTVPPWLAGAIGARLLSSSLFVRHVALDRWFLHRQRQPLPPRFPQDAVISCGYNG